MFKILALVSSFALSATPLVADIYSAFNYKLGEQYKSVLSRIDLSNPYNCKNPVFSETMRFGNKGMLFQWFNQSAFLQDRSKEKIVLIYRQVFTETCDLWFSQILNFCVSNGEMVYQGIALPLYEHNQKYVSVLDPDSKVFVGFANDEEAINTTYGSISRFTAYSMKHNALRESHIFRGMYKDPKIKESIPLITHRLYKTSRKNAYEAGVQLCPAGADQVSKYKPMYNSLDKVFYTGALIISHYERMRKIHNACVTLFPKRKERYNLFYDKFVALNEDDFKSVRAKVQQILVTSADPQLDGAYEEKLSEEVRWSKFYLNPNTDEWATDNLKKCDKWLSGEPFLVGSNRSKYWYDIDYVKNIIIR